MPKLWAADAVADAAFHGAHMRLARRALWSLGDWMRSRDCTHPYVVAQILNFIFGFWSRGRFCTHFTKSKTFGRASTKQQRQRIGSEWADPSPWLMHLLGFPQALQMYSKLDLRSTDAHQNKLKLVFDPKHVGAASHSLDFINPWMYGTSGPRTHLLNGSPFPKNAIPCRGRRTSPCRKAILTIWLSWTRKDMQLSS